MLEIAKGFRSLRWKFSVVIALALLVITFGSAYYAANYTRLAPAEGRKMYILAVICTVVGTSFTIAVINRIIQPLSDLAAAIQEVARGDFNQRIEVKANDEISIVISAFNDLLTRVQQNMAEKEVAYEKVKKHVARLEELAVRDGLTGLYNYRYFCQKLRDEIELAKRYQQPMALLAMDLDNFKEINDTYGHTAGDRLLVTIARTLENNLRSTDIIARYGGDEFAVILPNTWLQDAKIVADKLRKAIRCLKVQNYIISVSIGCSSFAGQSQEELFCEADRALYQAKAHGKNKVMSLERLA